MGLMVHSLGRLPRDLDRSYYIYVLDFGWDEPLGNALRANFSKMADLAAQNDAVVIAGTEQQKFTEEVWSFHCNSELLSSSHVSGQYAADILPALLITDCHPLQFRDMNASYANMLPVDPARAPRLILIPLRIVCSSATEVVELIDRVFRDIQAGKGLEHFSVQKELHRDKRRSITDAIILQPNFAGLGVDLKTIGRFLRDGFLQRFRRDGA